MPDGRKRNSVRFSIINSEWPGREGNAARENRTIVRARRYEISQSFKSVSRQINTTLDSVGKLKDDSKKLKFWIYSPKYRFPL